MSWTATTRSGAPHKLDGDVASFAALLGRLAARDGGLSDEEAAAAELFDWTAPLHVARSPGRLDVMGGIADYSGSRVLQMPIGEACLVAAQRQPASAGVRAASFGSAAGGRTSVVHVALSELAGPAGPVPLAELRARLTSDGRAAWAAYVIGCLGAPPSQPLCRTASRLPRPTRLAPSPQACSTTTAPSRRRTEASPSSSHRACPRLPAPPLLRHLEQHTA